MAFTFGTQQPAAAATFGGFGAAKPATGFGSFGTTQPTSTFSGFGSTASSQPSSGFGTTTPFGVATSQPSTGFGTGFGAATSQPSTGFASSGFGSSTSSGYGSFGSNTAQPNTGFGGFGTNTAQPSTGFGTTFGATTTTQPSTGFGGFGTATSQPSTGFGTAFGAPATSQPSTGFGGFGVATSQPSAGFGTAFGSATTSQPSTGFGFGSTTSTAQPAFGNAFGVTTSQPNTGFGGFGTGFGTGTGTTATSTQSGTGFGGFGGFGTATTSAGSTGFGGFGTNTAAVKPLGFGAPFGGTTTTGFGTGFGTSAGFGTGTGFGTGSTFGGGGSGFGTGTGFGGPAGGMFGQQQPLQQQQPVQANPLEELVNSVLYCSLFGDERDGIMARWNMLQASWGTGRAYYSNTAQPLTLEPTNPFCRFKAIGYSCLSKHDDKEGLVSLMMVKKSSELEAGRAALLSSLSAVLGNKPNVKVSIESIKPTGPERSEVVTSVQESLPSGAVRKVPATELYTALSQHSVQLKSLGVDGLVPKVAVSENDVSEYLANPPVGVDPRLWKQAQLDNPDPKNLIPVPMIGFKALHQRIKAQEIHTKAHQGRLDSIAEEISELQKKHQDTITALEEAKRKQLELSHRILKVMVRQEATRKLGFTITPEEEQLRSQLECLQGEMATPTQFKGRLNELLSQVRLQSQSSQVSGLERYTMDKFALADVKSVLKEQQEGIQALVQLVKDDMKDLDIMLKGLAAAEPESKW